MARPANPEKRKAHVISIRLNERDYFGLTLMSRLHNEPMIAVVTSAIRNSFGTDYGGLWIESNEPPYKMDLLKDLWDERPSDRLANMAFRHAELMSLSEKSIWNKIKADPKYWHEGKAEPDAPATEDRLWRDVLADDWEKLVPED